MKKTLSILTIVLFLLIPINTIGVNIDTTPWQGLTSNGPDDTNYDIYEKLLNWTNEWCEGLKDDKEIVDAIFDGFVESEILKYGKNPNVHTTEEILDEPYEDGCYYAMCDGISQVFQDACAVQGIDVYKFWYLQKSNERDIKGIICLSPGLGRSWDEEFFAETETGPWLFIDEKTSYDYPPSFSDLDENKAYIYYDNKNPLPNIEDDVNYVIQDELEAYCFDPPDGHSINLYKDKDGVHLYDLSFETRIDNVFEELPLELDGKNNVKGCFSTGDWKTFREKYHDQAVDYYIEEISYTNNPESDEKMGIKEFHVRTNLYDETWPSPYEIKIFPPKLPPICKITVHCFKDENGNNIQDEGESNANGMYVYVSRLLPSSIIKTTDHLGNVNFFIKTFSQGYFEITAADKFLQVFKTKWLEFYYLYYHYLEKGIRKIDIGLKKASKGGVIRGCIVDKKNEALNATIRCKGLDNNYTSTKYTNMWPSSGEHYFGFYNLQVPGKYEILIKAEGYRAWWDTVELEDNLGGDLKVYNEIDLKHNYLSKPIGHSFLFEKLLKLNKRFNFLHKIIDIIESKISYI